MTAPPLDGLLVVEAASFVAGPTAGLTLAQLGADVVRIDPIGGAADHRRWPLADSGASIYWAGLNKLKRSVALDLSAPAGQELAVALMTAPGEDRGIVLSNAPRRRWLDPDALRERRRDLIFLHLTGRPDGSAAVDYTVNARVGFPSLTGHPGTPGPVNHVLPAWDVAAGLYAATGLLAAERHRRRTGEGGHVRIALSDVALATAGNLGYLADAALGRAREPDGNFVYGAFGGDFATADGGRVMVAALTPRQWHALLAVTGAADAVAAVERRAGADFATDGDRYRCRHDIAAAVAPWFAARTTAHAREAVLAAGALCEAYQSFPELVARDPDYSRDNPLFDAIDQPGVGPHLAPRSPLRFAGAEHVAVRPAPELGADTEAVLAELLGLTAAELGRLVAAGVVGGPGRPGSGRSDRRHTG